MKLKSSIGVAVLILSCVAAFGQSVKLGFLDHDKQPNIATTSSSPWRKPVSQAARITQRRQALRPASPTALLAPWLDWWQSIHRTQDCW